MKSNAVFLIRIMNKQIITHRDKRSVPRLVRLTIISNIKVVNFKHLLNNLYTA